MALEVRPLLFAFEKSTIYSIIRILSFDSDSFQNS